MYSNTARAPVVVYGQVLLLTVVLLLVGWMDGTYQRGKLATFVVVVVVVLFLLRDIYDTGRQKVPSVVFIIITHYKFVD